MALSSNRRNPYERSIVKQREREFSSRLKWEENAKYFHVIYFKKSKIRF